MIHGWKSETRLNYRCPNIKLHKTRKMLPINKNKTLDNQTWHVQTCTQSKTWFFKVTFLITNSRLTPNSGSLNHLKKVTSDVFRPWISVLPAWWWWGAHEWRSTTCDAQQWVDSLPCQTSSNITPPKNPLSLCIYIYIYSVPIVPIVSIDSNLSNHVPKQCPLRPSGLGLENGQWSSPGALSALQLLWHVSLQVVQVLHLLLLVLHLRPQVARLSDQLARWAVGDLGRSQVRI